MRDIDIIKKVNIIINSVRRLIPYSCDLDDLRQDVMLATWRCVKRYDASKATLNTYLERRIKGSIQDHINKNNKRLDTFPLDSANLSSDNGLYKIMLVKEVYKYLENYPHKKRLALKLWLEDKATAKTIALTLGISQTLMSFYKQELITDLKKHFKM